MSGHSKWSTIKHKKGKADAVKGNLFTKISKDITIASKEKGGDISTNFNLRLAIEKAKKANMPKENIERAIKKGTGELEGENFEEIIYEGFVMGQVALIIRALTSNKNRTSASLKHIFSKYGSSLGSTNSVLWMFDKKAVFYIDKNEVRTRQGAFLQDNDEIELELIDCGAEEIINENDFFRVIAEDTAFKEVSEKLENKGYKIENALIEYIPKEKITISNENKEKLFKIFEELEEDDDVNDYFTNADLD